MKELFANGRLIGYLRPAAVPEIPTPRGKIPVALPAMHDVFVFKMDPVAVQTVRDEAEATDGRPPIRFHVGDREFLGEITGFGKDTISIQLVVG